MNLTKKLIAIGATVSVIFMSVGAAIPTASATTIADGDLVTTADSSAVYYIQGSHKRVFPHANVYHSWGYPEDFSTVKTVTASELAAYEDANPMPFRDGSLFRGTTSSLHGKDETAVFYVEDSKLRPVKSGDIYQALFNDSDWSKVTWVPDDMLTKFDYELGENIESSSTHPDGSLVQYEGEDQIYLIDNGKKRAISDAAFDANRYDSSDVITIDSGEVYSSGSAITGVESGLLTPGWKGVSTTTGVTVSLDSSNPSSAVVPYGATNVAVLTVKLQAGGSDVSVDTLTFKRSDLGYTNDWDTMYLYDDSTRLTSSGRSISSDTHKVEFPSLDLNIAANSSKIIELRGDLVDDAGNSSNRHAFKLTSVDTSAEVTGLPLNGNVITIGGVQVGSATITDGTPPVDPSVGASEAEVATFSIQPGGSNDISFQQIVLTYSGSLSRSDISNLRLYEDSESTVLASASSIASNDTVTFTLDSPLTITEGNTKYFSVKATLGGEANEELQFYLENANHLTAMDTDYNFGAIITNDYTSGTTLSLKGGEVSIADNGPSVGNITKNKNDVVLNEFAMTAERDVEVRELTVNLECSSALNSDQLGEISDLRIKDLDTGSTLMSTSITACAASPGTDYSLTDTFNLSAGTTKNMAITIDISNDANGYLDDVTINADLDVAENAGTTADDYEIRDVATGNYLTDVVPTTVSGRTQTILASSITLATASRPATGTTYVVGSEAVDAYGLLVGAGDAGDINLRQIKANIYGEDDSTTVDVTNMISSVALYDNDGTKLGEESPSYSSGEGYGTVTFSSLDQDITSGQSKKYVFKVNLLDTYTTVGDAYFWIGVDKNNVTAYDENNASKTPASSVNTAGGDVKMVLSDSGTLSVEANSDTPNSNYIVANNNDVEVSKFDFTAEREDITVNTLTFELANATSTRSIASNVTISYDGNTKEGTLNSATNKAKFTDVGWTVDKDSTETITVAVDVADIFTDGSNSGDEIEMNLYANDAESTTYFSASSNSGTTFTEKNLYDNGLATANTGVNTMYAVKSVPTVTFTGADGTLVDGTKEIYSFDISADSANKIAVDRFTFDISVSGVTLGDLNVYEAGDTSTSLGSVSAAGGTGTYTVDLTNEEVINADSTKSYIVKTSITGSASDDSLVTELVNTSDDAFDNDTVSNLGAYDFIWSDYSKGVNHDASTSADWFNGYKVENFTLDSMTLSK